MKIQSSIEYPFAVRLATRGGFLVGWIILTLFLVVYYNVAYYWYTPLTGVEVDYIDSSRSALQVTRVHAGSPGQAAGLQPGDRLLTIDGQAVATINRALYTPKRAGEIVRYVVERAGQRLTFDVVAGDYFARPEDLLPMLLLGLLSLLVYTLGLLCLRSAPQDTRARLVGAVWLLAGLALAAGGLGYTNGGWFAVDVYLVTLAAGGYVSLAAHLVFPAESFSNRARLLLLRAQLGLTLLALAAYAGQRISAGEAAPPEALVSGALIKYIFYLTWLLNLGLLLKNRFAARDEQTRRQANLILFGTLLGLLPVLVFSVLPVLVRGPQFAILPGQVSAFWLVFIPLFYGYVIGQNKLLKIDLLFNRAMVLFALGILIVCASIAILDILAVVPYAPAQTPLFGAILCALAAMLLTVGLHRSIQVRVDHTFYDASYDFSSVITHLSERLSQLTERRELDGLLKVEFAQQMHIQHSELLLARDGFLELAQGGASAGPQDRVSLADDEICQFLLQAGRPVRAASVWAAAGPQTPSHWATFAWGRVLAPVIYNGALHGVWLLGDRLNGDYYSEQDTQDIHTVGQLAAVTLANLATVESLRRQTESQVREAENQVQEDEERRAELGLDMHDDILPGMRAIHEELMTTNPRLAAQLKELTTRLRQIIKSQRPSFLEAGNLVIALRGVVHNQEQLAGGKTAIEFRNLLPEDLRPDDKTILRLYRIAEEALSNAIKHAEASHVVLTLSIERGVLEMEIKDDGLGIQETGRKSFSHIGLAGMRQRADMLGATLSITSAPGQGTSVSVRLKL